MIDFFTDVIVVNHTAIIIGISSSVLAGLTMWGVKKLYQIILNKSKEISDDYNKKNSSIISKIVNQPEYKSVYNRTTQVLQSILSYLASLSVGVVILITIKYGEAIPVWAYLMALTCFIVFYLLFKKMLSRVRNLNIAEYIIEDNKQEIIS